MEIKLLIQNVFLNTRVSRWAIGDDPAPPKSFNPLKTNETKKRRNHRQKSSFIVKTGVNILNSLNNQ